MSAEHETLAVAIARVESKLDAYASRTAANEVKVAELDARLRTAAPTAKVDDIETRLRIQETRTVVTPAGLVGALMATATILGSILTLFNHLYP